MRLNSTVRLAALTLALALAGCAVTPAQVQPPAALATVTPWPVSGRKGWIPQREMRFGDYATRELTTRKGTKKVACPEACSRIDLGVYTRHFDETFSTATRRAQFTLVGPAGAEVDVQLTDQLDQHKRDGMTRWFGLPTDFGTEYTRQVRFVGTVQPADTTQPGWRFALREAPQGLPLDGWMRDDTGRRLSLSPLRHVAGREGGAALQAPFALGYAFELDGRVVGAVATVGAGTVWLSSDLSPEIRVSMAGLASAVPLRPNTGG